MQGKKINTEEFIKRATIVHGGRYGYSLSSYGGSFVRIRITCNSHGEFLQTGAVHLSGSGCPKCGGPGTAKPKDKSHFVSRSKAVHGDKFDYSNSDYQGIHKNLNINCFDHGIFNMSPANHYAGQGCPRCRGMRRGGGTAAFVERANEVHSNRYDYSKFIYKGPKKPSIVICKDHGEFLQMPDGHINRPSGCPKCAHGVSRGEQEVIDFIKSLGIECKTRFREIRNEEGKLFEIDAFVPTFNFGIEFNGTFWHSYNPDDHLAVTHEAAKKRHLVKFKHCQTAGIKLYQIKESEWSDQIKQEIWKSRIASNLGIFTKVNARDCDFCLVDLPEAKSFMNENHLQGAISGADWVYGLRLNGELLAVVMFTHHQGNRLNLSRLAFKKGIVVRGGADKIFKNAIKLLPTDFDIVTFSSNMYSDGGVYAKMGFEKEDDLKPSYEWIYKGSVLNKRRCRKGNGSIKALIGEKIYDHAKTEHENMFKAGARCLYDAGYQRWIFKRVKLSLDNPTTSVLT